MPCPVRMCPQVLRAPTLDAQPNADMAHIHGRVLALGCWVGSRIVGQQLAPPEGVCLCELLVAGHDDLLRELALRRVAHLMRSFLHSALKPRICASGHPAWSQNPNVCVTIHERQGTILYVSSGSANGEIHGPEFHPASASRLKTASTCCKRPGSSGSRWWAAVRHYAHLSAAMSRDPIASPTAEPGGAGYSRVQGGLTVQPA